MALMCRHTPIQFLLDMSDKALDSFSDNDSAGKRTDCLLPPSGIIKAIKKENLTEKGVDYS